MRKYETVPSPRSRALLALLVAVAVCLPASVAPAFARRLPGDLVAGRAISTSTTLTAAAPDITAPAATLTTVDGRELWSRNGNARRPMASITKIMTALVVLERARSLDATARVTATETAVGESSANIAPGDVLTLGTLLKALLIKSANEAATTLAQAVGGTVPKFVALMNAKAAQLGLKNTKFQNPHGLDGPAHYSSARDLATLAAYAMRDPRFRAIVSQRSVRLTGKAGARTETSTDALLGTYPGAEGIKTGFTNGAGYSFVAAAKRNGVELIAVILGTGTDKARFTQAAKLLDWGFKHYRQTPVTTRGAPAGAVAVADYLSTTVPVVVGSTVTTPVFDVQGPLTKRWNVQLTVSGPVHAGDRLGTLTVMQGPRLIARSPVVAATNVAAPGAWEAFTIWVTRSWRRIAGGRQMAESVPPPGS